MNHKIITDLILQAIENVEDHDVKEIICGSHLVGVKSRKMGLATWAGALHPVPENSLPSPESRSAKELAKLLESSNSIEASLGLAAVNSLLPDLPPEKLININAADLILELGKNKNVAVIGHFPFVEKMQNKFKKLMVFEKTPQEGDLEEKLIPEKLPEADLVAITATTISNKSLGNVLNHCTKKSVKMIIGPSTPVCTAMFKAGFNYIAGASVINADKVKEGILAGYSYKNIQGAMNVILK